MKTELIGWWSCSCVLVGTVLVPSRTNVDDEADKVEKDQIQDDDYSPLAHVQFVRDSQFFGFVLLFFGCKAIRSTQCVRIGFVSPLVLFLKRTHFTLFNYNDNENILLYDKKNGNFN